MAAAKPAVPVHPLAAVALAVAAGGPIKAVAPVAVAAPVVNAAAGVNASANGAGDIARAVPPKPAIPRPAPPAQPK